MKSYFWFSADFESYGQLINLMMIMMIY